MGLTEDIMEINSRKNISPGERLAIRDRLQREDIGGFIDKNFEAGNYEVADAAREVAAKYLNPRHDDYGARKKISETAILGNNRESFALVIGKKSFKLLGYVIILGTIATLGYAAYMAYNSMKSMAESRIAAIESAAEEEIMEKKKRHKENK